MSKKVFINNFDTKKEILMLIIIYNTQNVFKKFYFNLKKKLNLNDFNVVIINNNFPLEKNDDKYYLSLSENEKYTYININKNIGFLNTFKFTEKLFKLHSKNKDMLLFNCEIDSYIKTKIDNEKIKEIKEKIKETKGYVFIDNEYWENIGEREKFIKMIDFEHENMTHVQCFFHHPYATKKLDNEMRYKTVKKTISDMIKENNNIYIANKYNQDFYIYKEVKENINLLKNRTLFEYLFFKRMQYWHYQDKNIIYNKNIGFENFLKIKKSLNIKKLIFNFLFNHGIFIKDKNFKIHEKEKNIYFVDKNFLFFVIKKKIKNLFKNKLGKNFYYINNKKDINYLSKLIFNSINKKYLIYSFNNIDKIIKKRFSIYMESRI